MITSKKLTLAVQLALAVGAGVAAPALFAQDATPASEQSNQPQDMQAVVVTGSRIRQVDIQTQQPVFTMDRQDIAKTGLTTVGDIISHMTIQGSPTFNKQSVLASNTEQGGSYVDMRNLGADRTLVLVNGKRWVTGTSGMTDLSTIPSSIIDRIEVLKDGASAVYGSDAVTGVVNIITRQNFQGAEANAYFGQNEKGDGTTQQYDFTIGSVDDKSSIVMSASYNKQDVVWDRDRARTASLYGSRHPTAGNSDVGPLGKYQIGRVDANGNPALDKNGNQIQDIYALNGAGLDASNPNNYHLYNGDDADTYNANEQMMFQLPTEQKSLYVEGRYNFTDNLSFHSTAMYTERKSNVQIAGYPLSSSAFRGLSDGLISADNAYNPLGQDVAFYRRTTEMPRTTQNTNRAMHLDAGLEGWFSVGEHDWNWDVGVNWNKGSGTMLGRGDLNLVNAQKALGPSFEDADGLHCGTAGNAIDGCIPWNVLGGPEAMTPELRDYLFVQSQTGYGSKNVSYTANITGGLFNLASGGEVAFAAGVERREVSGYQNTDQFSQSGLSTTLTSGPTQGDYAVNEAYAELSIPLLQGLPGAQDLTFDLATRYSHYSNFGSTTNAKYGFKWKPIEDVMIRGNYAQAFRAPTIMDMFGGNSETFDSYTDPCDAEFGANAHGQNVYSACVAQLQAAGVANADQFRQLTKTGGPVPSADYQSANPFTSGSNPDLKPEEATTKTLGVVYSPSQVEGLSVSLDWYKIRIENVISGISANRVLKNCYQGDASYCDRFERDGSGQIVSLNRSLVNTGWQEVEGYDLEFLYRLPETSVGRFQIRSNSSYLSEWNSQTSPDTPVNTGVSWYSIWRLRNNTSLDWQLGNFGATWTVRYFSGLKEACPFGPGVECNMPNFTAPDSGLSPTRRVGAVAFNDLSARWDAPWNARISVGVNNIFDRKAPVNYGQVSAANAPPVNPAYDLDRYWFVSYNQKF